MCSSIPGVTTVFRAFFNCDIICGTANPNMYNEIRLGPLVRYILLYILVFYRDFFNNHIC